MTKPLRPIALSDEAVANLAARFQPGGTFDSLPLRWEGDSSLVIDSGRGNQLTNALIGVLILCGSLYLGVTIVQRLAESWHWISHLAQLKGIGFAFIALIGVLGGALLLLGVLAPTRIALNFDAGVVVTETLLGLRRQTMRLAEADALMLTLQDCLDGGALLVLGVLCETPRPNAGFAIFAPVVHQDAAELPTFGAWLAQRVGLPLRMQMQDTEQVRAGVLKAGTSLRSDLAAMIADDALEAELADAAATQAGAARAMARQDDGEPADDWRVRFEVAPTLRMRRLFRAAIGAIVIGIVGGTVAGIWLYEDGSDDPWFFAYMVAGALLGWLVPMRRAITTVEVDRASLTLLRASGERESIALSTVHLLMLQQGLFQSFFFQLAPKTLIVLADDRRVALQVDPNRLKEAMTLLSGACENAVAVNVDGSVAYPPKLAGWSDRDWVAVTRDAAARQLNRHVWACGAGAGLAGLPLLAVAGLWIALQMMPPNNGPDVLFLQMLIPAAIFGSLTFILSRQTWRLMKLRRRVLDEIESAG